MQNDSKLSSSCRAARGVALIVLLLLKVTGAQAGPTTAPSAIPPPRVWTAAQDHQNMMEQLGIKSLRPGPSGNENAPHHANYDESKANPSPDLPDVLRTNDGTEVTTPQTWWDRRRPQIVEDFDREVSGRVPKDVPKVTWTVSGTSKGR